MNTALVQPLFERESDNAPGGFYVIKGRCITCELPIAVAPNNVSYNRCPKRKEDGSLHCRVHKQPESDEEISAMVQAVAGSCVEAIRYCGTDARILAALRKIGAERQCDALQVS
jgi:hypothetical protein